MNSFIPKIKKLIKALQVKDNRIYLFSKAQLYSSKLDKVVTINRLESMLTRKEFFERFPEKKKNQAKYKNDFIKVIEKESFSEVEILLFLVETYKNIAK